MKLYSDGYCNTDTPIISGAYARKVF